MKSRKSIMSIKTIVVTCLISAATCVVAQTNRIPETDNTAKLNLTEEWDKTFPKSDKVNHSKVTFVNRFGIMLAADMYVPKSAEGRLAAIAVCGPFGAVKEQCSGLYAQEFAERGFITVAFDPSFTGESGGTPRSVASPDINTEDFSAAVDFLTTLDNVDKERIGILGICGWGGFSINAAAVDTRIKATVASTMYDISRCQSAGYFDASDSDSARHEMRVRLSAQRTEDAHTGTYRRTVIYADEIRSAVLLVHGENAHSRYFSEDTFKSLKGGNKRLLIVPGAVHTDLYDKTDVIPFDEIAGFYMTYLK